MKNWMDRDQQAPTLIKDARGKIWHYQFGSLYSNVGNVERNNRAAPTKPGAILRDYTTLVK